MSILKSRIVLGLLVTIVMCTLATLYFSLRSFRISYHLDGLRRASNLAVPTRAQDYLRPSAWVWLLEGKPADKDKAEAYDRHTQALVELGYFANSREFLLRETWSDDPAESSRREEERAHAGSVAGLKWHMFQMQRGPSNTVRLTVIARPQHIAGWEKLLRESESITNK